MVVVRQQVDTFTLFESIIQLIFVDELIISTNFDDGICTFVVKSQFTQLLILETDSLFEVKYNVAIFLELIRWFSYHLVVLIWCDP